MYLQQDGRAFPCCDAERALPIGDLRRSSLREIWNAPEYRALRLRMPSKPAFWGQSEGARVDGNRCLSDAPPAGFWALNSLPTQGDPLLARHRSEGEAAGVPDGDGDFNCYRDYSPEKVMPIFRRVFMS
jgi:hypothetical protein